MKRCTRCGVDKPIDAFYVRKSGRREGVVESNCKECTRARVNWYAETNREAVREGNRKAGAKFRATNRESERRRLSEYREVNRDLCNERVERWRKANPHKHVAKEARRRASKQNATPAWANPDYIALFYELAKLESERTGVEVHVDHIVPLKSSLVCGLHCEHNLQLLTASANLKKSNRVWPDMPN